MLLKGQTNRYIHCDIGKSPASFAICIKGDSLDRGEKELEDWENFFAISRVVLVLGHGDKACIIRADSLASSRVGKN